MKVLYKHEIYGCNLSDAIKIIGYKMRLRYRRLKRRIKVLITKNDLELYLFILLLWIIFAFITWKLDMTGITEEQATFAQKLWELKNSVFSSVIIAFVIGVFNRGTSYKNRIMKQHFTYVDTMDGFESLLWEMLPEQNKHHFHPMYNDRVYNRCIEFIFANDNRIDLKKDNIILCIDVIERKLSYVEREVKSGVLVCVDEEILILHINNAKNDLNRLVFEPSHDNFKNLYFRLFNIIDELRKIWRRDEKLDSAIIEILGKYDENRIREDYYKRMFLKDFNIFRDI